jgi:hypothetical protein
MGSSSQNVFCAFCRLERKVYMKRSISWTNVMLSFFGAIIFMYGVWQGPDARASLFFVFFLMIAEIFIRIRWRVSLPCPHCAFDPLLYKTDRRLAVAKVNQRLAAVRESGKHLLNKNNPFLNLPTRAPDESARTLSKQV